MSHSELQLSFAERIKQKSTAGFDSNVKEDMQYKRDRKEQVERPAYKVGKNMPKQKFSKLPVSVIKHIKGQASSVVRPAVGMDPRFQRQSGTLNQGLFAKSYSFIKELQQERKDLLKNELIAATKIGDEEAREKIKRMMGEEKALVAKQKRVNEYHETIQKLKQENKQRVLNGQAPHFAKKRDIKEFKLREKFEDLESKGLVEKYIGKMAEENDKKRFKR